jgi:hypothetical protein
LSDLSFCVPQKGSPGGYGVPHESESPLVRLGVLCGYQANNGGVVVPQRRRSGGVVTPLLAFAVFSSYSPALHPQGCVDLFFENLKNTASGLWAGLNRKAQAVARRSYACEIATQLDFVAHVADCSGLDFERFIRCLCGL